MKSKLLILILSVCALLGLIVNISNTTLAQGGYPGWDGEYGGDTGSPGDPYTVNVRCTTTTDVDYTVCACFTDPYTGKPEFCYYHSTSVEYVYVDATFCNYYPSNSSRCSESIPC